MTQRTTYHHGDLRAALVAAALELVAERGVPGLSVAEAARRAGVSPAAPYRHFPNRTALLSAAAGEAARQLSAQMDAALSQAAKAAADDHDPAGHGTGTDAEDTPAAEETPAAVETLALLAGVYVRYALGHGPVFELILADELHDVPDNDRRTATRELFDHLLWPAMTITGGAVEAEPLLRGFTAIASGYAHLRHGGFLQGFPTDLRGYDSVDELFIGEASEAVRTLARAAAAEGTAPGTGKG